MRWVESECTDHEVFWPYLGLSRWTSHSFHSQRALRPRLGLAGWPSCFQPGLTPSSLGKLATLLNFASSRED